jgi:hypothetical protein
LTNVRERAPEIQFLLDGLDRERLSRGMDGERLETHEFLFLLATESRFVQIMAGGESRSSKFEIRNPKGWRKRRILSKSRRLFAISRCTILGWTAWIEVGFTHPTGRHSLICSVSIWVLSLMRLSSPPRRIDLPRI